MKAKANGNDVAISSPSIFRFAYNKSFAKKFNAALGYTILMSDFTGSDLGYGFDFGVNYYLLSPSNDDTVSNQSIKISRFHLYKPYVGIAFYQRQFQSTKSSYAGPGINAGIEKHLNSAMSLKAEMRHINLSGPGESKASEMNFLIGISFKY